MMMIQVDSKPRTGRFDRVCLACGEQYFGWNMYVCKECERAKNYTIIENW